MKILFAALLFTLATFAPAQDLARQHAAHLQHGINTSGWFSQAGHYEAARLKSYTTEDDLKLIHEMGFDHVRLSLDATPLLSWQANDGEGVAYMAELDRIVSAALADHLAVIIDLHPEDPYKRSMLAGDESLHGFTTLWAALATHFGKLDPALVFFELMNEPEQTNADRWRTLQLAAIAAIRPIAPLNTIIVSAIHWDGLPDLLAWKPVSDPNVLYSFHDYDPMTFTHQGATWAGDELKPLRAIPYPATPANLQPLLSEEPSLAQQYTLEQYALDHWNAERMDISLGFAEEWAQQNHAVLYCGEFGVFSKYAPAADRARWIHDMRVALEKHGIGWAMWDYQTEFGIVKKAAGMTTPDPAIVQALGLKEPR